MDGLSEGELRLRARVVDAARGARWLADGWRFFRAAPLGWTALAFGYLLLMIVASSLQVVGLVAFAVLTPGLSVGFMAVARVASRGAPIELPLVLEGFRLGLRSQIGLGFVYAAFIAAVLGASRLLLGEMPAPGTAPEDAGAGLAWIALMYVPGMMMFWFAPILAAWHSTTVAKALFFSVAAFLMNWRAFLVYGAVTGAAIFSVVLLVATLARSIAPELPPGKLMLPLFIVVFPTLAGSYYASYRDVFTEPGAEPR